MMNRPLFALIFALIAILALAAMWWGWRARARRDAGVVGAPSAPSGERLAHFPMVTYVSTTPVGEPLVRVSAPGLRYRGRAEVSVFQGGITIEVTGEAPVHIPLAQVRGSGSAGVRVGKAVERDGLALLRWEADGRELESSFRFDHATEQREFTAAIDALSSGEPPTDFTHTTQEDAR
ncbi:hypothetical protein ACR5KS_10970 [Leucobacter sp. W1153]|uniref:PH-like domain-containing protein n=1 Tax=Leucobacter sp. W1153 TaxID=3439064 RepID=UPI003F32D54E